MEKGTFTLVDAGGSHHLQLNFRCEEVLGMAVYNHAAIDTFSLVPKGVVVPRDEELLETDCLPECFGMSG